MHDTRITLINKQNAFSTDRRRQGLIVGGARFCRIGCLIMRVGRELAYIKVGNAINAHPVFITSTLGAWSAQSGLSDGRTDALESDRTRAKQRGFLLREMNQCSVCGNCER